MNLADFMLFLPRHVDRSKFITLDARICSQHLGRDTERRAVRLYLTAMQIPPMSERDWEGKQEYSYE